MQNNIEITLVAMNEIAREGLARILTSENFKVRPSLDSSAFNFGSRDIPQDDLHRIIIVDRGANGEGLEVCRQIIHDYPDFRVVLLADGYEYEDVATAFRFGVDGYIIKEISCEPLFESLRLIALGEKVLPSQLAESLCNQHVSMTSDDWVSSARAVMLSDREVEVLAALTLGMANKVISRRHNISEATVKVHVKAILRKLRVANRTQAAIWAIQHGLHVEGLLDGTEVDLRDDLDDDLEIATHLDYAA